MFTANSPKANNVSYILYRSWVWTEFNPEYRAV